MAFVYWVSSFLLFGHGFDTRRLFITCMYFFLFHYRLYSWVWKFFLQDYRSAGTGAVDWIGLVYFISSFLLFGHGFDTRGLFRPCIYLFPFHSRLYSWIWTILIAKVHKGREGCIGLMAFVYWISSFLLFGPTFDTRGLFITCMNFYPFHYRLSSWIWRILIAKL